MIKKYDLFQSGDSIIRVLDIQDDRILMIDCLKQTMPVWVEIESLESYSECSGKDLYDAIGVVGTKDIDDLDSDPRKKNYFNIWGRKRKYSSFEREGIV